MALFNISPLLAHLASTSSECSIIGIDGVGCAGKTSLAAQLSKYLGAAIIHFDDFYRVLEPEFRATLSPPAAYQLYFDWERFRNEFLLPISGRALGEVRKYDWNTNTLREASEKVDPTGYLIVEGVYSCRSELRAFYDHTIFVRIAHEIREERARARVENSPFWIERWMAAEDFYISTFNPEASADWIFDGATGAMVSGLDSAI